MGFIVVIVVIVVIVRVTIGGGIRLIVGVIIYVIFGDNFTVTITDRKAVQVAPDKTMEMVDNVLRHW